MRITKKFNPFLGHANVVEFLLKNKAHVNEMGSNEELPLHKAASKGNVKIRKISRTLKK